MEHAKRRIRMQVRATPEAGEGTFVAKVSTYEIEYEVGWGWTEQIMSGCFDASIAAHPTIPIFYNHNWDGAPIGSGKPTENEDKTLSVAGRLYLGMGDLVARVYQAMQDEALEEWSVGFWPEEITWASDNPKCDTIVRGDLAEASVCIRGANPETGTLELNARGAAWVEGTERDRKEEVRRLGALRSRAVDLGALKSRADSGGNTEAGYEPEPYREDPDELVVCPTCNKRNDSDANWCDQCGYNLHLAGWRPAPYHQDADELVTCPTCGLRDDVDAIYCDQCGFKLAGADGVEVDDDGDEDAAARRRAAGHTHQHKHGDTVHSHAHTHSGGNYGHDGGDMEVPHGHDHPEGTDMGEGEDPGPDQSARILESPALRHLAAELR